jgi:hypothetical protein
MDGYGIDSSASVGGMESVNGDSINMGNANGNGGLLIEELDDGMQGDGANTNTHTNSMEIERENTGGGRNHLIMLMVISRIRNYAAPMQE